MGVITITKQILNLRVSFNAGGLLVYALTDEIQLIKAISEDEAFQFFVYTLGSDEVLEAPIPYSSYSIGLLRAKICLKDEFKVITRFNMSIKINIMTKKLIEDVNLAMK